MSLTNPLDVLFGEITIDLNAPRAKRKTEKKEATQPKPKTEPKPKSPPPPRIPINRDPAFHPVLAIIELVTQECTTCGSHHSFLRSRLVRFEKTDKNGMVTAVEIPTLVPERLPRRVDEISELTNCCPTCLSLTREIDDFLSVKLLTQYKQLELFHD